MTVNIFTLGQDWTEFTNITTSLFFDICQKIANSSWTAHISLFYRMSNGMWSSYFMVGYKLGISKRAGMCHAGPALENQLKQARRAELIQ